MKRCWACKTEKPLTAFGVDKSRKDGLQPKCKQCISEYHQKPEVQERVKRYQASEKRKETVRQYLRTDRYMARTRRYAKSEKFKTYGRKYRKTEAAKENIRHQRQLYPNSFKARGAVNNAVRSGALSRAKDAVCSDCGGPATQYHHWSYEPQHWLNVVALCNTCHSKIEGRVGKPKCRPSITRQPR